MWKKGFRNASTSKKLIEMTILNTKDYFKYTISLTAHYVDEYNINLDTVCRSDWF